ncbi:MAG: hypothetical protein E4H27_03865 [Anaerolineales bacterium]|nr:MAG: hypothetical protein E4H27_03865 [Anaerolineales bacterium]
MARRKSYQPRHTMRLRGAERILFILGATIYILGAFSGLQLISIPINTAIILLVVGGGLLLIVSLSILF